MNSKIVVEKIRERLENIYIFNTTVSIYVFFIILYKKIINFDLDQRAAAVSFSFLLAVFPGTLFLFTLIPYIPIENLQALIMDFTKNLMPEGLFESVRNTMEEIISRPRVDILSFGFAFALFAATNGMSSLMRAFNMALRQREKRSYLKARWIALVLTFLLILVLITAISVLIVGKITLSFMTSKGLVDENLNIWAINFLVILPYF